MSRSRWGEALVEVETEYGTRSWVGRVAQESDLRVAEGERVRYAEELTWGSEWCWDVLRIHGPKAAAALVTLDLEDALDLNRMLVDARLSALIVGRMLSFLRL